MLRKLIFLIFTSIICFYSVSCIGVNNGENIQLLSYSAGPKPLPGSPYSYETWDFSGGSASSNKLTWYGPDQRGGGAFKAEWNGYFLARLGLFWGNGGVYTQYDNIYIDYDYTRSDNASTHGGFIGMYGWSRNPSAVKDIEKLIEYYVVDDWFWNEQMGSGHIAGGASNVKEHITITVDGASYKIYTGERHNQPSIDGTKTFIQIFSVRQSRRTSGTISVTEHFKEWNKIMELGSLYEVKFKAESFGGIGYLDLNYLSLSQKEPKRVISANNLD
ncbi:MAG: glycoside hydrolase family 11 protein [Treponema sp.]|nr:glycoside hydrolase family 11 protein [Treponema sp.]